MPEPGDGLPFAWSPGLDRGFIVSGEAAGRLYLRPAGMIGGAPARAAVDAKRALPLAGGPLAFTLCELLLREEGRIRAAFATLPELDAWAKAAGGDVERHILMLLERISALRPPFAGLALARPRIMGIVNVTPDSFSDGGDFFDASVAIAHGKALAAEGADILDIGGESTRPGAEPVAAAEEIRRVLPVIEGLRETGVVLSIDSRSAAVMRAALERGATILNDVTALGDPASLALAAERQAPVVLMHMQGEPRTMQLAPRYDCAPLDVYDMLSARVEACLAADIPRARVAVDPGIGFGKRTPHNLGLFERLSLLHGLGCAILLGASRKRLLALAQGSKARTEKDRLGGSLAAAFAGLDQGVQLLRVHDVEETAQAARLWRAFADPSAAVS